MPRCIVLSGFVILSLLLAVIGIRRSREASQAYAAESLLLVRPFSDDLLKRAFEREARGSAPGIIRLGIQILNSSIATPNGTARETNGLLRVVALGGTTAEAERLADGATDEVRTLLRRQYGLEATSLGPVQSAPASSFQEPVGLRFGNTTPGYFPTASKVVFPGPAISIEPGRGWMRSYALLPTKGVEGERVSVQLIGQNRFNGGFISAFRLSGEATNEQSAVVILRATAERQPGFVRASWTEEPWTGNGIQGVHMRFAQEYPAPFQSGTVLMTVISHDFLVTNAHSHWVCLRYVNASSSNVRPRDRLSPTVSEEVLRMVQRTLRVE